MVKAVKNILYLFLSSALQTNYGQLILQEPWN
jgi:hypothetical protein